MGHVQEFGLPPDGLTFISLHTSEILLEWFNLEDSLSLILTNKNIYDVNQEQNLKLSASLTHALQNLPVKLSRGKYLS